jgi:ribosomal protein S18 acetylase RimI-like enzyme
MTIRELTQQEFDELIFPLMSTAFADTFSYSIFDVRTEKELEQFPRLKDNFRKREFIYLGAFDSSGEIAGYSISYQARTYELYTQTSVVLPQYRRKGIYTSLTKKVLEMALEKGYQMITSNHVTSNNSVIMAKLKLGFKITGFEIYDDFGSLVKLTYFLNEKRSRMFDVRTGFVRPDEEMKGLLKI